MNKKKFKNLLVVSIIIITIAIVLCSCLPNRTSKSQIVLLNSYNLGEFNFTQAFVSGAHDFYGIREKDRKAFVEFLRSSPLYVGEITLKECAMSSYLSKNNENVGNEYYVFADNDNICLGRFYARKYFSAIELTSTRIELSSQYFIWINKIVFSNSEEQYLENVEYSTPWTWEELKMFFHYAQIDEDNHTFVISQDRYSWDIQEYITITAQITYNEQNSTLSVRQID